MHKKHVVGENTLTRLLVVAAALLTVFFSGCTQAVVAPETQESTVQANEVLETDRIYDNIFINGIQVGGLTRDEAFEKLKDELFAQIKGQRIIVKNDDATWALELSEIGYGFDIEGAVSNAYDFARTGSDDERLTQINELKASPYDINTEPHYDLSKIDAFLKEIADEINVPATEPVISRENGQFTNTPGKDGVMVDVLETRAQITTLADVPEGGEVALVLTPVSPRFSAADLEKAQSVIGVYSTPITGSAQRDVNLTVASGYVNAITMFPGDVFSTNATIGPTTYERGYRSAPVIVNGQLEDGIGGGVCQVSSTLYNAVLRAELNIVERKNHSLVVGYCPIGMDATLAGDYIDFKFENSTEYPIYIESYLEGRQLFVKLFGHETRPAGRTLTFDSVRVGTTQAPATKETPDPTLPLGERVTTITPINGQVIDVYKNVLIDGVQAERVYVDRSTYRTRAGEVRVGTGPAAPSEQPEPAQNDETPEYPDDSVPSWLNIEPPSEPSVPSTVENTQDFFE